MSPRLRFPDRTWLSVLGLMVFGSLIRIPQLGHDLNEDYGFRQTQTAMTVREYARNGIDLFHAPLPVFGAKADVPFEFPLWQAIAALFVKAGMPVDGAVRLLALLSFQLCALALALLVRRWHGRATAIAAVALFEVLPFGLLWGDAALIDFFSVAMALFMIYGLDRWLQHGSRTWLILGSLAAILGFLVKASSMPGWCVLLAAAALAVLQRDGWRAGWSAHWRRICVGAIGPFIAVVLTVLWNHHADSIKVKNPLTVFLTSGELHSWYYGTRAQRSDGANYQLLLTRLEQGMLGPLLGVVVVFAAVVYGTRATERIRTLGWLLAVVATPLVLFNLYVVHTYYMIAIYPAVVAAMAIGGVWLFSRLPGEPWQRYTGISVVAAVVVLSTAISPLGDNYIKQFAHDRVGTPVASTVLDLRTEPGEASILIGCDWDPTYLYYADRPGMMIRTPADAANAWASGQYLIDEYHYLLVCGDPDVFRPSDYLPADVVATPDPEHPGGFFIEPT